MSFLNEKHWNSLEQWSPALLYIAGSLHLLLALPNFIEFNPSFLNLLGSVVYYLGPASSILAIAGIIGIYPNLSDLAPKLSRVGVIFLVIAAITILIGFVPNQLVKLNQSQSLMTILSSIQQISLAALFVGHLLLSIATFSTEYYSNILGYLLLIPAILTGVEVTVVILQIQGNLILWGLTTMSIILALDYLTLGYIIGKRHTITYPKITALWSKFKRVVYPTH